MNLKDALELKNREKIYKYVYKYPGLHLREILRGLDLSEGTIRYHLEFLEKNNLITKRRNGRYVRFYPSNKIDNNEKLILNLLRNKKTRDILIYILVKTSASRNKLSEELEKDPSTIYYHLKKLLDLGVIEEASYSNGLIQTSYRESKYIKGSPHGREIVYRLSDPYTLYNVIITYESRMFDDGFVKDIMRFLEACFRSKPREVLNSDNEIVDDFSNVFFDFFPAPFCA